ncbi:FkbM family methyltransferase [Streptomyces polyrhachis]|uniref:FkbM family methyltransferase n=1 Tax=Streptomyces polyrhachis TaxID=1282885 RepID=A0ABW2GR54_9ACTN
MSSFFSEVLATLVRWCVRNEWGPLDTGQPVQRLNEYLRDRPRQRVAETRFGARFELDTQDLIQRYLYLFGVWEPHMAHWLKSRLRPGDVLVDVGANIGEFSILGSQLVGSREQVVAIEASPTFHRRLLQNAALNDCVNIRAVNVAVSEQRQKLTFVLASSQNMGANSIVPYEGSVESTFEIEALPLAEILKPDEVAKARVIKIDVEGAEGSVIRGLVTLLDVLPQDVEIAVEVTPERMVKLGDSVEELTAIMERHGFHPYRLPTDYTEAGYLKAIRHPVALDSADRRRDAADLLARRCRRAALKGTHRLPPPKAMATPG